MNIQPIDYLVHFSNVLLLVSYSVRNILWLRWFAVAAALTNMPYFLMQHTVLWPPILWAVVFTAINLYQISRIYLERRPVVLSGDEQRLYDLGFQSLRPREFVDKRPDLRVALQALVSRDLAVKVERLLPQ